MNTMLDDMKTFFQNPKNVFEMRKHFRKDNESKERRRLRVKKIIEPLNTEDFKDFMIKFFLWEQKYEDLKYEQGVLSSSHFFNSICDIASEDGLHLKVNNDEDFLANRFQYKHFVFELYVGQGSFWRVYHTIDKEVTFQTT